MKTVNLQQHDFAIRYTDADNERRNLDLRTFLLCNQLLAAYLHCREFINEDDSFNVGECLASEVLESATSERSYSVESDKTFYC